MEQNTRNQRPYSDENERWDQNQWRQGRHGQDNDYNQPRNYQSNYGNESFAGNEYRQNPGSRYGNTQQNENDSNRWQQNYGRRHEDDFGNDYRNRQQEGYRTQEERRFSNEWNYGDRNIGNRGYDRDRGRNDDQRNFGSSNRGRNEGQQDRDWFDRTRDEVSSWFGDDDAERRRRQDRESRGEHRGKGPKDYQRSAERIREDVCDRLSDDSYVDASEIEIKMSGTEVILNGTVDSKEAKRRAEDIAESVSGVSNVQNHLRVGKQSSMQFGGPGQERSEVTGGQQRHQHN